MQDLANQIAALSAAATPGEWQCNGSLVYGTNFPRDLLADFVGKRYLDDRDLIITLRNAVPQIIAALNAQAEVEALRATLKWYADQFCEYPDNEGCGKYEDGTCSGCRARKSLEAKP